MRVHRLVVLGVALVVPQLGGAQLPIPTEAFGKMEGVLDFCAKANPKDAAKYEKIRTELVKNAPDKDLPQMRKTQAYKDAFEQAKSEFTKMPKDKVVEACSASLGNSK